MTHLDSTRATEDGDGGLCDGPDPDKFSTGLALIAAMLENVWICFGVHGVEPRYLVATHPKNVALSRM